MASNSQNSLEDIKGSPELLSKRPFLKDLWNLVTPDFAVSWKEIGSQLGIQNGVLHSIELNFLTDVAKCCDEMLEEWLNTDVTATWVKLIDVVYSPTVTKIINTFNKVPLCIRRELAESEAVEKLECKLKERHTETRFKSSDDDWFCKPEHFTSVALIHQKRHKTRKEIIEFATMHHKGDFSGSGKVTTDIADIFASVENTGHPYTLLIEGAPGIGKTILSKEIVFQWAKGNLLTKENLVFLIYLRDPKMQTITSFPSFITYITYSSISKDIEKYIENISGKGVTLVFDGYDEYPEGLRNSSFLSEVINQSIFELHSCNIIITSRPSASAGLYNSIDLRVEILGFTKEQRKSYINYALKDNSNAIQDLFEYLESTYSVDAYCHIPLSMAILVFLFKECGYNIKELPATQTAINYKFICIIIRRFIKRSQKKSLTISKFHEIPVPHRQILLEISKLAFKALKEDKIVFTTNEVKSFCPNLWSESKNWSGLDLLKAVQCFSLEENSDEVSFSFLHFSVQELLAAYHISLMSETQQIELLRDTFWNNRYFNAWIMYVALSKHQPFAFKHYLSGNRFQIKTRFFMWWSKNAYTAISKDIKEDKVKCLHLFQCFTEAGNGNMCHYVSELLEDGIIDLSGRVLSAVDLYTLSLFLARCVRRQWNLLDFSNCYLDDENCEKFCKYYGSLTKSTVYINMVNLSCNNFTQSSAPHIANLILSFNVKHLLISSNEVKDIGIDKVTFEALLEQPNLVQSKSIEISDKNQTVLYLCRKGRTKPVISELFMMFCCTDETYKDIRLYIENISPLLEMFLSTNRVLTFEIVMHRLIDKMTFLSTNFKFYVRSTKFAAHEVTNVINILSCAVPIAVCIGDNCLPVQLYNIPNDINEDSEAFNDSGTIFFCGHLTIQVIHSLFCSFLAKTNLKQIYLHGIILYDCFISNISTNCTGLNGIQFVDCAMHDDTVVVNMLNRLISKAILLEHLNLSGCRLKHEHMLVVSKALKQVVSLKTVAISDNNLSKEVSGILALVIARNKVLQIVKLSNCNLQDAAFVSIIKALENCKNLQLLDLSNNTITDKVALNIAILIERCRSIQDLRLHKCGLQHAGVERITQTMIKKIHLCHIDFSHNVVSDQNAALIASVIVNTKNLKKLNFSNCKLHNTGCKQLFQAIAKITNLLYLDLSSNLFNAEVIKDFALMIHQNISLEYLNVSGCCDTVKNFEKVTGSLVALKSLNVLDMSCNVINIASAKNIAIIITNNSCLENLNFSKCEFHEFTFLKIMVAMQNHCYLKYLFLNSNPVGYVEAAKEIVNVVSSNPHLEYINLSKSNIAEEELKQLLLSLKKLTLLKFFDISFNTITNLVVNEIADVIDGNTQLTHLNISNSEIPGSGILKIFEAAKKLHTLKCIKMYNCHISDQAAQSIADAISVNGMIEELQFTNNGFHEKGFTALLKVLQSNHGLKYLNLAFNNVISNAISEITEVLYKNFITHFNISNCDLQESSCSLILNALLLQAPILQKLDLSGNDLKGNTENVAQLISVSYYLQCLNLANTSMQHEKIIAIVKAMQSITSLCCVDLMSYSIDDELAAELQIMMDNNHAMVSFQISKLCFRKTISTFHSNTVNVLINLQHISICFGDCESDKFDAAVTLINNSQLLEYLHLECCTLLEININNIIAALERIKTLKYFCLINVVIADCVVNSAATVIKNNVQLQHFQLVGCKLTEKGFTKFINSFNMKKLSCLVLSQMKNLSSHILRQFKRPLFNSITQLNLSYVFLDKNKLSQLLSSSLAELRTLSLSHNPITDEGADILSAIILNNSGLKHLDLCDCKLQSKGIRVISNSLRTINVDYLNLSINTIDIDIFSKNLMPALLSSVNAITYLHLPYCELKQKEIDRMSDFISKAKVLKYFDVGPNAISEKMIIDFKNIVFVSNGNKQVAFTTEGIKQVNLCNCETECHYHSLQYLNVNNIIVNDEVQNVVFALIVNSPNLKHLEMAGIKWNYTSAVKCFRALKSLLHLNLRGNSFTLTEMLSLLIDCTALRTLDLHNCGLKSTGIVSTITKNITALSVTNLTFVDLSNNSIDDEAVDYLAVVVATNVKLEYINLCNCNLKPFGIRSINKALRLLSSLKFLDISLNKVDNKSLDDDEIGTLLVSNKSLEQLKITKLVLNNVKIYQTVPNLLVIEGLQQLIVNSCFISDEDTSYIISLIIKNPLLHMFYFLDCEMSMKSKLRFFCLIKELYNQYLMYDAETVINVSMINGFNIQVSLNTNNLLHPTKFNLTDDDVVAVMTNDDNLGELIMFKLLLNQDSLDVLSTNAVTIRGLKLLHIENCIFTDYYAYYVAYLIATNVATIQSFSLTVCQMSVKQKMILNKALRKLNIMLLQYLNFQEITNIEVTLESNESLRPCFTRTDCKLTDDIVTAVMTDNINLKISKLVINQNTLQRIGRSLKFITGLVYLAITDCKFNGAINLNMARIITNNDSIQELTLSNCVFSQNYFEQRLFLPNYILEKNYFYLSKSFRVLSSLTLVNVTFATSIVDLIVVVVTENPGFSHFTMSSCYINEEELIKIMRAISKGKNLLCIKFSHLKFSDEVIDLIATVITCNTKLKHISLCDCQLVKSHVKCIIQLGKQLTTLKQFNLNCNDVTNLLLHDIATLIANNKNITMLNVPNCILNSNHLKMYLPTVTNTLLNNISTLVATVETITTLTLLNCSLSNDQLKVFLSVIKECSPLKCIGMNINELANQSITDVKAMTENHSGVKEADKMFKLILTPSLTHQSCCDLLQFKEIQRLIFVGCTFDFDEWDILKLMVFNNTTLNTLILFHCQLYTGISDIVKHCPLLNNLYLDNVNILRKPHDCDLKASKQTLFKSDLKRFSLNKIHLTEQLAVDVLNIIHNSKNLEHFTMVECKLNIHDDSNLWKELLECQDLMYLNLSHSNISGEIAASILTPNKKLTHFVMASCDFAIHMKEFFLICDALREHYDIVHLNLNNNKNVCYYANDIATIIRNNENLEHIELAACNFDEDGIFEICKSIHSCTRLQHINLSQNKLIGCIIDVVVSMVSLSKHLKYINLQDCGLMGDASRAIIAALKGISSFRSIDLSCNEMEEDSTDHVAEMIDNNENMEVLCLPRYKYTIASSGIDIIMKSLQKVLSLQILDIGNIEINAQLIKVAINCHIKLRQLILSKLSLNQQGFEILSKCDNVIKIKGLKHISITSTIFTITSVKKLILLLSNNPTIQTLNFAGCVVPFTEKVEIFSILVSFGSLQSFNICGITIGTQLEDKLAAIISKSVTLKHLEIAECQLSNSGIEKLLLAIRSYRNLHLNISGNFFSSENFTLLVDLIQKSAAVDELKMSSCNITDFNWILTLLSLKELKYLDISHNPVTLTANCELDQKSFENDNLHFLSLFNCTLSSQCTAAVITELKSFSSLQYLNLSFNTIEVDSTIVNDIATLISNNQQITDFLLPTCVLSNDMIRHIFDAIKSVKSLKHIDLSSNQVNNDLTSDVAALTTNTCAPVQLNFSELALTHNGFMQVDNGILILEGLNKISITGVDFTDSDSHNLGILINKNKSLQSLDISDCIISEIGKNFIFEAMINLTSLKSLSFKNVVISDAVKDKVLNVITNNTDLEYLELTGCKMNTEELDELISDFNDLQIAL